MEVDTCIASLIQYGLDCGLIEPCDRTYLINQLLRMLQPDTDGQSLRLDGDAGGVEIAIDIPCGVAGRQDHRAHKGLAAVCLHADHLALTQDETIHAGLEMHLSPTTQDLLTHPLDHPWQLIGADMGMGIDQDSRACPMLTKDIQDLIDGTPFLAACVELSIGVGTGTPLAKAVIRFAVDGVRPTDLRNVFLPFVHILATFEDDRA